MAAWVQLHVDFTLKVLPDRYTEMVPAVRHVQTAPSSCEATLWKPLIRVPRVPRDRLPVHPRDFEDLRAVPTHNPARHAAVTPTVLRGGTGYGSNISPTPTNSFSN